MAGPHGVFILGSGRKWYAHTMKTLCALLLGFNIGLGTVTPASADGCQALAQQAASQYPGASASGKAVTNGQGQLVCRITIRIPPQNNQPGRVINKTVRP